ncbi:HEAT repeat domain-containing protein [Methanoregula sp.]|uniref:HEAT repeat domain-containing protein n=1 Tax=Methanoregula sp. TaxID=2052170 RepID=UPI002C02033F|nr:HEAT repeat domain-containing protein [Methanoregula sp.]HVP96339.1 HEAT repeat domain-containing protein [Methanoregula sp.]
MTDTTKPPAPEGAEDLERQGIEVLISTLKNNADPAVRRYAAFLLGNARTHHAIRPLIEALGDLDKSVREQAMLALVATGKATIEPLSVAMKDPKWETRYRAAEALGRLADENAVKPLIRGLQDSRDHVRYMAAKGLTGLGDSTAIDPLIILLKDENPVVRMMTIKALSAIGGTKARQAITEAMAGEKDEHVRKAMTEALR